MNVRRADLTVSSLQAAVNRELPYTTRPGEVVGTRVLVQSERSSEGEDITQLAVTLGRAAELDAAAKNLNAAKGAQLGEAWVGWFSRWTTYYQSGSPAGPFGREAATGLPGFPGSAERQAALAATVAKWSTELAEYSEAAGKVGGSGGASGSPSWMPIAALVGLGALAFIVAGRR